MQVKYSELYAFLNNNDSKDFDCEFLWIFNSGWTIYPPGNSMPDDAVYFDIPSEIEKLHSLKSLQITGLFLRDLPNEIKQIKSLEEIFMCLCLESDIKSIAEKLEGLPNLKMIILNGSIISDKDYRFLRNRFTNAEVVKNML